MIKSMVAAPWLLYYAFLEKIKNKRNFEIQFSELISQILPKIEKLCNRILL